MNKIPTGAIECTQSPDAINGLTITKNNLSRFNKRLHKALKTVHPEISLSESSHFFAKSCGKKNLSELKNLLDNVSQKEIKELTEIEELEFFEDVKLSKKGNSYKNGISDEYLFNAFYTLLTENSHKLPSKFHQNSNFGFKLKFTTMNLCDLNYQFLETIKFEDKIRMKDLPYHCFTDVIKQRKLKIANNISEFENLNWNKQIVIILYEFSPINLFNGKKMTKEFYSMFFIGLNKNTNKLDLVFENLEGEDDTKKTYVSGSDSYVSLPLTENNSNMKEIENTAITTIKMLFDNN